MLAMNLTLKIKNIYNIHVHVLKKIREIDKKFIDKPKKISTELSIFTVFKKKLICKTDQKFINKSKKNSRIT